MSLWSLSWVYLMRRWGGALLTIITGALAIGLLGTVISLADEIPAAAKAAIGGADMVVGPKGSELDLVMCCALHITPTRGLVSYKTALAAVQGPYVKAYAPVALGDSYNGTRILWSRPSILDIYGAKLAQGRIWNGAMEVVAGAEAMKQQHLHLGQHLISTHGLDIGGELHKNAHYTVVGVLKPTGTVIDRLILADMKSIKVVHIDMSDLDEHGPTQIAGQGYDANGDPIAISAMLARFSSPIAAAILPRQISTQSDQLTAASPELELARLSALVRPAFNIVLMFGALFGAVAALMAAIGLISALNQRSKDLALLRVLGATRAKVARVAVQEALILSHAAFALGLLASAGLGAVVAGKLYAYGLYIPSWFDGGVIVWLYVGTLACALLASLAPVLRVSFESEERLLQA